MVIIRNTTHVIYRVETSPEFVRPHSPQPKVGWNSVNTKLLNTKAVNGPCNAHSIPNHSDKENTFHQSLSFVLSGFCCNDKGTL